MRTSCSSATIAAVPYAAKIPYAVLRTDGDRLTSLQEKPEENVLCNAGIYMVQPEVLLNARLYPDMYPLTRQIQTVCDFAGKTCARLTGSGTGAGIAPTGRGPAWLIERIRLK